MSRLTIDELLSKFPTESQKKGKIFEDLVCWWLTNDPYWKSLLLPESISLWTNSELRWGPDAGIDITAKDIMGHLWAIQAKNWQSVISLPKGEVDKFLTESNTATFTRRLLVTTTAEFSAPARGAISRQQKPVTVVSIEHLRDSPVDWAGFLNQNKVSPPPRKTLRPHQTAAVDAVVAGFKYSPIGQLVMACGTGKTVTAQRISETLAGETTLVLVPSLLLLQQTLNEWNSDSNVPFKSLAVCSDESVTKELDESVSDVIDLGVSVTTDPTEIVDFLSLTGRKVIFSTYQSSLRISEALQKSKLSIDLVIGDEAHRLAGQSDEKFSVVLDPTKLPAKQKLFMTATPRLFDSSVRSRAKESDIEIISMDDHSKFGPVFYEFTFQRAIRNKMLVDYRLVVLGVDDQEIAKLIKDRRLLSLNSKVVDAKSLASQVGLIKAMKKYGLRKVISFHSRISKAAEFSSNLSVVDELLKVENDDSYLTASTLSGKDNTHFRKRALRKFLTLQPNERHIVSNARCLNEGIDVPSLDGIAFIDPRASQVDIVQAVGRAIRLGDSSKEFGYIVVPIFVPSGVKNVSELKSNEFAPVFSVLRALTSHDEHLRSELANLRTELGETGTVESLPHNITIDMPLSFPHELLAELNPFILENTTESWLEIFGELKQYISDKRSLPVPISHKTRKGTKLYQWIAKQRIFYANDQLSEERTNLLESLGSAWTWTPWEEVWQQGIDLCRDFLDENDGILPADEVEYKDFPLGRWVAYQRRRKSQNLLSQDRIDALESMGSAWTWTPKLDVWPNTFEQLFKFCRESGHLPRQNRGDSSEQNLGKWCNKQRISYRKGLLSEERRNLLESIPNWNWDPLEVRWQNSLMSASDFFHKQGRLPRKGEKNGGTQDLWLWLNLQRENFSKGQLSDQQIKSLDEFLPVWKFNATDLSWEEGITRLSEYLLANNKLPSGSVVLADGYKLGDWVSNKRSLYRRGAVNQQRIEQLESIEGWIWDLADARKSENWTTALMELTVFEKLNGHLFIPARYISESGFKLGEWVNRYRTLYKRNKLNASEVAEIEKFENWVWDARKKKDLENK